MAIDNRISLTAALFLLAAARLAVAQDSTRTWSLGVDNQSGVYVAISVSPAFRLEPEIAVQRLRDHATITLDNGFGTVSVFDDEVKSATYRLGLGLLWQWQRAPQLRFYAGPRFGVIHATANERVTGAAAGSSDATRNDWFVAGSLGAEYFPIPRLSAGADVQLRGVAQGTPTQHTTGSATIGAFAPTDPTLSTRGLLMVRFYL
ncbi:MAG TPA: hypothetical protein VJW73_07195 [Gemmatimonadaceae bacterium]|nr:hypothetical protein [Gemmatimonadaceae bacterium]